jgi:hypothetical protein
LRQVSDRKKVKNINIKLIEEYQRKRSYGGPKSRCEDNIKVYFGDIGREDVRICFELSLDMDQWQVFVNSVLDTAFSQTAENVFNT